MLMDQVGNSETPSTQLLVDSQLLGLWFASGNRRSLVIQQDGLKALGSPVQYPKKSQLPSNFTLFLAWLFLLITVAAMLAPISISWGQESDSNEMGTEKSALTLPE